MRTRRNSSLARFDARRLAIVIAALAAVAALPGPVWAQTFDRDSYEQHARECVNNLEYAEQAMGSGNVDRALTYIELAVDPCDQARNLLITGMDDPSLNSRQTRALQGDLVSQDSRWASLAAQLGLCEEARQMLAETTRLVPEIPSDRMDRYLAASQAVLTCTPGGGTPGYGTPGQGTPGYNPPPTITGMPLLGTVTVGPGYAPATGSGLAGGPDDASMRFGDPCWGAITADPTFQMVVTSSTLVNVSAQSEGDLTLVVSGPGGTYCNDDYDGLNPGISEMLAPGTYSVWVGEFSRTGTGTAFTASFSAGQPPPQPYAGSVTPTYGYVTIGPGYSDTSGAGTAGGNDDASRFGEGCRGGIPSAPQYQLDVTGSTLVTIAATSQGDLTLAVTGPGGTWCNDDYSGLNPTISDFIPVGTYQVYVGEYSRTGTGTPYEIQFSTQPPGATSYGTPPGGTAAPTYGTAYVGPGYGMTTLNGVSGGTLDASMTYGGSCTGYVASAPDYVLEVSQASTVNVGVTATDGGDTTLVVTGPGGTFCNDDTNGLNPAISQYMSPGTYQVFVGSYWEGEYHNIVTNFSAY